MHAEPLAHVTWFTDPSLHPTQYGLLLSPQVLAALALAALAIGGARWIQRRYPEPDVVRFLGRSHAPRSR